MIISVIGSQANSYAVGSVDRKGRFPIHDQIGYSYAVEKVPFRSQLFRSSNPIRASRRKGRLFQRDARIGLLDRKSFEAHRISHHPRKPTITPYNSSDAGLTALRTASAASASAAAAAAAAHSGSAWRPVLRPPAARTVIRWQQQQRVIDDLFATPLRLLCSLWGLSTSSKSSNATAATMKRMRAPRAPSEHFARGKVATKTCA